MPEKCDRVVPLHQFFQVLAQQYWVTMIQFTSGLELRTPLDIPTSMRHMLQLYLLQDFESMSGLREITITSYPYYTPSKSLVHYQFTPRV